MLDIRTRIWTDLNPSKRIRFRIRSENIRTVFIPSCRCTGPGPDVWRVPEEGSYEVVQNRLFEIEEEEKQQQDQQLLLEYHQQQDGQQVEDEPPQVG